MQSERTVSAGIRLVGLIAALGTAAMFVMPSPAAPSPLGPAGDECDDPIPVTDGTTLGATTDNTGTTGNDSSCGSAPDDIDEWLEYTATCDGFVTATTCNPGTNFDTILSVFDECDGAELACNDDSADAGCEIPLSGNLKSKVAWQVTAGSTYLIRVSGWNNAVGDYELTIACQPNIASCPPDGSGDECSEPRLAITGLNAGTTQNNTGLSGDDTSCSAFDTLDEWFCWTAPCDGEMTATTCLPGTDFDTTLGLFALCGVGELVCNDDTDGPACDPGTGFNTSSTLTYDVEAGHAYLIRVAGYFGASGNFELQISIACPCPADLNSDNVVNVLDLLLMLGAWGSNPGDPADLNADTTVNVLDLLLMLGAWGPC